MIIDRLNALLPSPKDIHIIYCANDISIIPNTISYVDRTLTTITEDISYDFVYDKINKKLYKNDDPLTLVDDEDALLSFDITDITIGMAPPDGYIGVEVDKMMDNAWPPNMDNHHLYVVDNINAITTIQYFKKGEFLINGEYTYILNVFPYYILSNWIKLKPELTHEGSWWNKLTTIIDNAGTMELGKTLDFHNDKTAFDDYSFRLTNNALNELTTSGTLIIGDNLIVSGNVNITGTSNMTSLNVSGDVTVENQTVSKDLMVLENSELSGTLLVSDVSTFNDTINTKDVNIIGEVSIDGKITLTETITANDLMISNNATITNDLAVLGIMNIIGNVSMHESLSINNNLNVLGDLNTKNIITVGDHNISNDLTVENILIVSGISNIKDLNVDGDINLTGKYFGDGSEILDLNGSNITSGTINYNRLPVGNVIDTVADGLHVHNEVYQLSNPWQIISIDYMAVDGDRLFVDTASNIITISLPLDPTIGTMIIIKDMMGTFDVNNLIIERNGSNILSNSNNVSINTVDSKITLIYTDNNRGWILL